MIQEEASQDKNVNWKWQPSSKRNEEKATSQKNSRKMDKSLILSDSDIDIGMQL